MAHLRCGAFLAALFKETAAVLSDETFVDTESEAEIAGQFRRYMVDGMITSHNEVCCAKVFTNDRVPDSLARTGHAHGQWEEC